MASRKYSLKEGEEKRLEIKWNDKKMSDMEVHFDGELKARFDGERDAQEGKEIRIDSETTLSVSAKKVGFGYQPHVLNNGVMLADMPNSAENGHKGAYGILFFVAAMNIILGVVAYFFRVRILLQMGIGLYSIGFGVVMAILGIFVMRKSLVAMIVAILVYLGDIGLGLYFLLEAGGKLNIRGMSTKVIFLVLLIQGAIALSKLKKREASVIEDERY